MRQLKRLLHYIRPYWFYVAGSVVSMALVGLLDAFRLLLIGPIFDFVLNPSEQSRELHLLPTTRWTLQLNWFVPGHFHNVWTMVAFALVGGLVFTLREFKRLSSHSADRTTNGLDNHAVPGHAQTVYRPAPLFYRDVNRSSQ